MSRNMKQVNRWFYGVLGAIVMLCAGCIYSWSVFSAVIGAEYAHWAKAELSLTFTITMISFCIASILAGVLSAKISWKLQVIVGGCFYLIGFTITSNMDSLGMLYFGFGVLSGFGTGLVYSSTISTVTKWFTDKMGLISGIMLMGFGFGSFLIGKVFSTIAIQAGGWRNAFQILGTVMCIITVAGAILLQRPKADFAPPQSVKKQFRSQLEGMDIPAGVMLKRPAFWCFYLWSIVLGVVGLSMIAQAGGLCVQIHPAIQMGGISTAAGLISIFNGAGRVIFGRIYDMKGHKLTMRLVIMITILAPIVLSVALFGKLFPVMVVAFILFGLAYGGLPPLNSALISEFFGRTHYAVNFPIVMSHLIFASLGATLSGKLFDMTGSYFAMIIMMLIFIVIGFVLQQGVKKP